MKGEAGREKKGDNEERRKKTSPNPSSFCHLRFGPFGFFVCAVLFLNSVPSCFRGVIISFLSGPLFSSPSPSFVLPIKHNSPMFSVSLLIVVFLVFSSVCVSVSVSLSL